MLNGCCSEILSELLCLTVNVLTKGSKFESEISHHVYVWAGSIQWSVSARRFFVFVVKV